MDWFSWLSKTGLDPSLIYEYGLAFSRNELQFEDVSYFDHEFLQSMGISVAKHRLEILKLAKKERSGLGGHPRSLSTLSWALIRTKKCFSKYFNKWVFHEDLSLKDAGEGAARYQDHWRGALLRKHKATVNGEVKEEKPVMFKTRSMALSGPLDGRVQERLMANNNNNNNNRSLKLSGPLDGKVHERLMYTHRSPRLRGPSDVNGRAPERLLVETTRSPKLSGPLEGRTHERLMVLNKSPRLSGPLDGRLVVSPNFCTPYEKERVDDVDYDDHSLWTALFQDMKPT
ncbi:hypothetical protein L3X38_040459 [Prunus dulcis]|uniref:SAM domain-containing protein n=1 Tax=Prunus dulcis TaxID=3755 RepID=A0AAD4YTF9_PRUDU|nr:hypothetical protein L3X38_040459 [Prunus dulcis]